MTEVSNTSGVEELITVAKSQVGVSFTAINGRLEPIAVTSERDFSVKLKGKGAAFALTKGTATAMSGAIVVALPGTKVRANSGSVVVAYRDVEVVAKKGAIVFRVLPFVKPGAK
jgi:hypothetical protein